MRHVNLSRPNPACRPPRQIQGGTALSLVLDEVVPLQSGHVFLQLCGLSSVSSPESEHLLLLLLEWRYDDGSIFYSFQLCSILFLFSFLALAPVKFSNGTLGFVFGQRNRGKNSFNGCGLKFITTLYTHWHCSKVISFLQSASDEYCEIGRVSL